MLNPSDSFLAYNNGKLVRLAELYPMDFSEYDCILLKDQLETYILDVRDNNAFSELHDIASLAKTMVETKKNRLFSLVYKLIELALILPVATESVERVFSAMNIIKTELRNKMGDEWMNDSLVVFVEREVFKSINNESICSVFKI